MSDSLEIIYYRSEISSYYKGKPPDIQTGQEIYLRMRRRGDAELHPKSNFLQPQTSACAGTDWQACTTL
jgi:hypothetical protein